MHFSSIRNWLFHKDIENFSNEQEQIGCQFLKVGKKVALPNPSFIITIVCVGVPLKD
jgi:hypothetical protein